MSRWKMDPRDIPAAAEALMDWFESQEISAQEAVPVMALAISAVIHASAADRRGALKGAGIVGQMITETVGRGRSPGRSKV